MARLSLCMIVKNEGPWLASCLNSVEGIADEIIVVDTGSTDASKSIATAAGATVVAHHWEDDFSAARNAALKMASGDWILVLDADETVSALDHEKLLRLISQNAIDAFTMIQRSYGNQLRHPNWEPNEADKYIESKGYEGWIASTLVRLFKNREEYRYRYRVHEVVEPAIEECGGKIADSYIPIHHYTHQKNEKFIEEKLDRYLAYGLKQIKDTPALAKPYLEVALIYIQRQEWSSAERLLVDAMEVVSETDLICDTLATVYLDTNRLNEAERVIRKGLRQNSSNIVLQSKLASLFMSRRAFDQAERLLKEVIQKDPHLLVARNNLGMIYAVTGRLDLAIKVFKEVLSIRPSESYALTSLGMIYVKLQKFDLASPVLEKAYVCNPGDPKVLYHLALVRFAHNKRSQGLLLLREAQRLQSDDPIIAKLIRDMEGK